MTFPVFQQIAGGRELVRVILIAYMPVWPFLLQPDKLNWWAAGWVMVFLLLSVLHRILGGIQEEKISRPEPPVFESSFSSISA